MWSPTHVQVLGEWNHDNRPEVVSIFFFVLMCFCASVLYGTAVCNGKNLHVVAVVLFSAPAMWLE